MRLFLVGVLFCVASAHADSLHVVWRDGGSLMCPDGTVLSIEQSGTGGTVNFELGGYPHYEPADRISYGGFDHGIWDWHIYSSAGDDHEQALCELRGDPTDVVLECMAIP